MEQDSDPPLNTWRATKILMAVAMTPVVLAALLLLAAITVSIGVAIGLPYYYFAREIHDMLIPSRYRSAKPLAQLGRNTSVTLRAPRPLMKA